MRSIKAGTSFDARSKLALYASSTSSICSCTHASTPSNSGREFTSCNQSPAQTLPFACLVCSEPPLPMRQRGRGNMNMKEACLPEAGEGSQNSAQLQPIANPRTKSRHNCKQQMHHDCLTQCARNAATTTSNLRKLELLVQFGHQM